jgi:ubiquinone/menaquinone biosynthesis C-methylase UbiE
VNIQTVARAEIDATAVKRRQRLAWSAGDYAVVGSTLQIVGETLCEAVDLRANQRVLDVAAGNGNATLAAARRYADVVSTDYVGALLERGRERAEAEGLAVTFQEADAEDLPFADRSFDVVLSTFGVMFTPDHGRAAEEMARVCRSGGKIGLASWTPESLIGRVFKLVAQYVPRPPGAPSPAWWGTRAYLESLFDQGRTIATQERVFVFRYKSPAHWVEVFRSYYGPIVKVFEALDAEAGAAFAADLHGLLDEFNTARDGTLVAPGVYLEAVVTNPV